MAKLTGGKGLILSMTVYHYNNKKSSEKRDLEKRSSGRLLHFMIFCRMKCIILLDFKTISKFGQ